MELKEGITKKDIEQLKNYLKELDELNRKTPNPLWLPAAVMEQIRQTDVIPEEYADKVERLYKENGKPYYVEVIASNYLHSLAELEGKYQGTRDKLFGLYADDPTIQGMPFWKFIQDVIDLYEGNDKRNREKLSPLLNGSGFFDALSIISYSGKQPYLKERDKKETKEPLLSYKLKEYQTLSATDKIPERAKFKSPTGGINIIIKDPDNFFGTKDGDKTAFIKVYAFVLQECANQQGKDFVRIKLDDLVKVGMYKNVDSARLGLKQFYQRQDKISLESAQYDEEGHLFYHRRSTRDGYVEFAINQYYDLSSYFSQFTYFPNWGYELSYNAFVILWKTFYLIRLNSRKILKEGKFKMKIESVRETLNLPTPDDVPNRRYKYFITDKIEKAVKEINETNARYQGGKGINLAIIHGEKKPSIREWLDGYIEVEITGEYLKVLEAQFLSLEEKKRKPKGVKTV